MDFDKVSKHKTKFVVQNDRNIVELTENHHVILPDFQFSTYCFRRADRTFLNSTRLFLIIPK